MDYLGITLITVPSRRTQIVEGDPSLTLRMTGLTGGHRVGVGGSPGRTSNFNPPITKNELSFRIPLQRDEESPTNFRNSFLGYSNINM